MLCLKNLRQARTFMQVQQNKRPALRIVPFLHYPMKQDFTLKRIVVGLDLTEMDAVLMRFTAYMAKIFNADSIYFLHVAENLDMPKEIREKYPNLMAPVDEGLKHKLEAEVKKYFGDMQGVSAEVEVREGDPLKRLLKFAKQKDVDLIAMGQKSSLKGKGVLTQKVARVAHRSVMLVPENLPETFSESMDKLLVPVDFSKSALLALDQAVEIKKTSPIPVQITALNVYQLPTGWHSTGKSSGEFAEIMERNAREDFKKFAKNLEGEQEEIDELYILDNNHDPVREIYDAALALQADLIVLGSRGKTEAAAFLMGSTAERLAQTDKKIPLLIVKDKDENIGFLKALLKI